ncbi:WG repeat-containing protein [Pontibacillus sp. ALD_SL1]|uniref:WG repeat-containing protein n=1 Tax=Pontibacillus sp. ALD_SL1 TaxID=2777185 RepID=UPI001A96A823|nr:WG repeat-containing protein [Pontibacillus sp. ALD_SL1]QSS99847.1 WG repeat-containing protein [Pontibacillus sp. ALD_SL1]
MGECKNCGAPIEKGESCEKCTQHQEYIQNKNEESMFDFEPQQHTYETPKKGQEETSPEPSHETTVESVPTIPVRQEAESEDPFLFSEKTERKSFKRPKITWLIAGILIVLMSAAFFIYSQITSKDTLYFTVGNKIELGFINGVGEMVLETDYDSFYPLYNIQQESGINGRGPHHIVKGYHFTEDLYPIMQGDAGETQQYGFINKSGEWVIEPTYEQARAFYGERALVVKNGAAGFINYEGELVIPAQYPSAKDFKEGFAPVYQDNQWGFIDINGDMLIDPAFDEAFHFNEGIALVVKDREYQYINTNGEQVMDRTFEKGYAFSEGLAPVEVDGKFGFIDKEGNMKIDPQYKRAYPFHEGVATVCLDEKCGVINKGGHMVVDAEFEKIGWYVDGLAYAITSEKSGYIDTKGDWKIGFEGRTEYAFPFYEGLGLTVRRVENPSRGDGLTNIFEYRNKNGEIIHQFKPF